MKKFLFLFATLFVMVSCGSNDGLTFNPTPEMKGTLAKYYDVKDVTVKILRDENTKDWAGNPKYFIDVTFTIVKNDVPGIEKEWSRYDGTMCCNMCSAWPPYDGEGKYLWGIGFTIEDANHNDVVTLREGETPGGGKLFEYCITPGQEYHYVWNISLDGLGWDENEYKVMTKIYNGEMQPHFYIVIGQNVWCGVQQDLPKLGRSDSKFEEPSSSHWDSVLNDYEIMVDKYIALLKKANAGDMDALTEYVSYMEKAQDLANKLDEADDDMTSAQMKRYMKISEKMASAVIDEV